LFSLRFLSRGLCMAFLRFWSWYFVAVSISSPSPHQLSLLSFSSYSFQMPKGIRSHRKRPNGVLKVVSLLDSSLSFTCQNLHFRIIQLGGNLFDGGLGVMGSLNSSVIRSLESIQILNLLGLTTVTMLDTQSVGTFTVVMIFSLTIRSIVLSSGDLSGWLALGEEDVLPVSLSDQFQCDSFPQDIQLLRKHQTILGKCQNLHSLIIIIIII
jgi:hypothetical protein